MKKRNTQQFQILSVESDAKTVKGNDKGFLTAILYLAPHTIASKKSLCPYSTPGCRKDCLFTAGRGIMQNVKEARIARTKLFVDDYEAFKAYVIGDIKKLVRIAEKRNLVPAVRLNGTSDNMYERIFAEVFAMFPMVQFYDYTKIPIRYRLTRPSNYHLTFSLSEENMLDAIEALNLGVNVAVVFPVDQPLPTHFLNRRVIDGDESDLRFTDEQNVIVGLTAKGLARYDEETGFVIN